MNHCEGHVFSVALDSQHRFGKRIQESITLVAGYGISGDAHAGQYAKHRFLARRLTTLPNNRQVHLIPAELFGELRNRGYVVAPGELGENVATAGLKLEHLPLGTKLHLGGTAVVELTGIRTPCRQIDRFQRGLRQEMLRTDATGPKYRCGVLGIVVIGGRVFPGDLARAEVPTEMHSPLPAL
jgi:MOSC domain-containing protein YiiM